MKFPFSLREAVSDADFVQENDPERPDFKADLFHDIDSFTPPNAISASNSSGLTMGVIQAKFQRPERCVILTDQVKLSKTNGKFQTVLVPRGSSRPEWLSN
ncbi:3-hydroxyacyl-CoA dehydrogenase NAD-binding domain-containing protein [Undibacterium sp. TJN25]|uniref:3-hydroxyacyl-CoA dehydrogenase NAD-binding domain-containing protein n=1 Tax=Undibacterium sp. TJN25 TaxID=3413056 RepID=UPI003BF2FB18